MIRATESGPIGEKQILLGPEDEVTIIKNVQLIDGTGKSPEQTTILLRGDRIEAVQPAAAPVGPAVEGARVIDATGKTAIPGLIDVHVHLTGDQTYDPYRRYLWPSKGVKTIRAALDAYKAYRAGWTTMVDLGWPSPANDLRFAINTGLIAGPRILTAIAALSHTGGHGDWHHFPYEWVREREWRGRVVDGVEECRKAVRLNYREGADLTKIMLTSGGLGAESDWPPRAIFGQDELAAIVDETRKHQGIVAAHCMGGTGVRRALEVGVATVEHGVLEPDDYDLLGRMAEQSVTLVPTLSVFKWFSTEGDTKGMSQWAMDTAKRILELQFAMVDRARQEGVTMATGTDTGSSFGIGLNALELELLVDAGLTPMEAISAATKNAAECRDVGDHIGTIEPGKLADILILDTDPIENIRELQDETKILVILRSKNPIS